MNQNPELTLKLSDILCQGGIGSEHSHIRKNFTPRGSLQHNAPETPWKYTSYPLHLAVPPKPQAPKRELHTIVRNERRNAQVALDKDSRYVSTIVESKVRTLYSEMRCAQGDLFNHTIQQLGVDNTLNLAKALQPLSTSQEWREKRRRARTALSHSNFSEIASSESDSEGEETASLALRRPSVDGGDVLQERIIQQVSEYRAKQYRERIAERQSNVETFVSSRALHYDDLEKLMEFKRRQLAGIVDVVREPSVSRPHPPALRILGQENLSFFLEAFLRVTTTMSMNHHQVLSLPSWLYFASRAGLVNVRPKSKTSVSLNRREQSHNSTAESPTSTPSHLHQRLMSSLNESTDSSSSLSGKNRSLNTPITKVATKTENTTPTAIRYLEIPISEDNHGPNKKSVKRCKDSETGNDKQNKGAFLIDLPEDNFVADYTSVIWSFARYAKRFSPLIDDTLIDEKYTTDGPYVLDFPSFIFAITDSLILHGRFNDMNVSVEELTFKPNQYLFNNEEEFSSYVQCRNVQNKKESDLQKSLSGIIKSGKRLLALSNRSSDHSPRSNNSEAHQTTSMCNNSTKQRFTDINMLKEKLKKLKSPDPIVNFRSDGNPDEQPRSTAFMDTANSLLSLSSNPSPTLLPPKKRFNPLTYELQITKLWERFCAARRNHLASPSVLLPLIPRDGLHLPHDHYATKNLMQCIGQNLPDHLKWITREERQARTANSWNERNVTPSLTALLPKIVDNHTGVNQSHNNLSARSSRLSHTQTVTMSGHPKTAPIPTTTATATVFSNTVHRTSRRLKGTVHNHESRNSHLGDLSHSGNYHSHHNNNNSNVRHRKSRQEFVQQLSQNAESAIKKSLGETKERLNYISDIKLLTPELQKAIEAYKTATTKSQQEESPTTNILLDRIFELEREAFYEYSRGDWLGILARFTLEQPEVECVLSSCMDLFTELFWSGADAYTIKLTPFTDAIETTELLQKSIQVSLKQFDNTEIPVDQIIHNILANNYSISKNMFIGIVLSLNTENLREETARMVMPKDMIKHSTRNSFAKQACHQKDKGNYLNVENASQYFVGVKNGLRCIQSQNTTEKTYSYLVNSENSLEYPCFAIGLASFASLCERLGFREQNRFSYHLLKRSFTYYATNYISSPQNIGESNSTAAAEFDGTAVLNNPRCLGRALIHYLTHQQMQNAVPQSHSASPISCKLSAQNLVVISATILNDCLSKVTGKPNTINFDMLHDSHHPSNDLSVKIGELSLNHAKWFYNDIIGLRLRENQIVKLEDDLLNA